MPSEAEVGDEAMLPAVTTEIATTFVTGVESVSVPFSQSSAPAREFGPPKRREELLEWAQAVTRIASRWGDECAVWASSVDQQAGAEFAPAQGSTQESSSIPILPAIDASRPRRDDSALDVRATANRKQVHTKKSRPGPDDSDGNQADEAIDEDDGLPVNLPPASAHRASEASMALDPNAAEFNYYNGSAGRQRFWNICRAMKTRPIEAERINQWVEQDAADGKRLRKARLPLCHPRCEGAAARAYLAAIERGGAIGETAGSPLEKLPLCPRPSMLQLNSTQELDLRAHQLADSYGSALAEALPFLPHVRALRLRDNRLTDKGLAPLVGAACQLSSLRRLELGQNVLGTHGANALLKLLDDGGCPLEVSACVAPFSDAHF